MNPVPAWQYKMSGKRIHPPKLTMDMQANRKSSAFTFTMMKCVIIAKVDNIKKLA